MVVWFSHENVLMMIRILISVLSACMYRLRGSLCGLPPHRMVTCMYSPVAAVKSDVCCIFSFPGSIDASYTVTKSLVVCHIWNQEMRL